MARTQVQAELIATNAISGTIIADNAITATHIATNSISGVLVQDGGIVTTMIAANNVTAAKIVSNGVLTRHISDDQVTGDKIASATIVSGNIANNAILTQHIDDNQVGIDQLNVSDGSNGQMLTTNGSGTLSFSTPSSFDADAAQVFNESGNDVDFRIESNGSTHMFHVDAGNNKILMSSNPADDTQATPHDTLTLALAYASSGANGVAGLGPRLAFKIPDDEDNPSLGGGIAVVKESADDSDSSAAMTFATSQNDETLDEAMRITSAGDVGIGQTPIANSRLTVKTQGDGTFPIRVVNSADTDMLFGVYESSDGDGNNGMLYLNDGGGTTDVKLSTNGDSYFNGGKLAIGADHADEPLTVRSSGENVNTYLIEIGNDLHATNTKDAWIKYVGGAATTDHSWATGILSDIFRIVQLGARATTPDSGTQRMHILADGEVVFNSAIADTYAPLVNGVTGDAMVVGRHSTSGSLGLWRTNTMEFKYYHNGQGYIMTFGSNGVLSGDFNDTSDVNLKENISSISDGTTVIKALRPVKFDWKASGKGNNQHGFIAQEVETVLPNAVTGNNYVENETGLPEDEPAGNGKNMNSNAVLAHAVKAIQELEARIKTLEDA